jgi:hypothetical protein
MARGLTLVKQRELFKQFSDNPAFRKWLLDNSFKLTYKGQDRQP